MSEGPIRVLVVDDSAFSRRVMREVLSRDDRLVVVGIAYDGIDALEKIAILQPDVLTLDLVMPELDGGGVLQALKLMPHPPLAVVVSSTSAESYLGVDALDAGAFDVVHKPTALANDRMYEIASELVRKVVAAGDARRRPTGKRLSSRPAAKLRENPSLIVIGASTGGPRAVSELVGALPAGFAIPLAIVLHMPVGYTEAYALRLDQRSAVHVREADEDGIVGPGEAVIARGGAHLVLQKRGTRIATGLSAEPSNGLHRPSVDRLFKSAADACGSGVLAIVLTGMGDDGAEGAGHVRAAGGRVIIEDSSTCVVHGMPRAVKELGHYDLELPLPEISSLLGALSTERA